MNCASPVHRSAPPVLGGLASETRRRQGGRGERRSRVVARSRMRDAPARAKNAFARRPSFGRAITPPTAPTEPSRSIGSASERAPPGGVPLPSSQVAAPSASTSRRVEVLEAADGEAEGDGEEDGGLAEEGQVEVDETAALPAASMR